MTLTSMHTHTAFCDGRGTVEEYCRTAREKGFFAVGFSAHAPVEPAGISSNWHLKETRLEAYLAAVREARKNSAGAPRVFPGLEIDYISGRMGPADTRYRAMGLDFTIGSVHYLPPPLPPGGGEESEPLTVDGPEEEFARLIHNFFHGNGDAAAAAYWRAVREMIAAGGFDILGHIDIIKKNNAGEKYFSRNSAAYTEGWENCVEALARSVAATGRPAVEINTGGLVRGRSDECFPEGGILEALVRAGIPLVITSDAHDPAQLGGCYDAALAALKRAGGSQTHIFQGRDNAGRPLWTAEPV